MGTVPGELNPGYYSYPNNTFAVRLTPRLTHAAQVPAKGGYPMMGEVMSYYGDVGGSPFDFDSTRRAAADVTSWVAGGGLGRLRGCGVWDLRARGTIITYIYWSIH